MCLEKTYALFKTQFKGTSSVELVWTLVSLWPRWIYVYHRTNISFLQAFVCPGLSTLMDRGPVWFIFIFTATSPKLALFAAKWKQGGWSLKSLLAATFHSLRKQSQISSTLNQHAGGSHCKPPFPALKAWAAQVWTQHGIYCCHEYDTLFDWASCPVDSC